MDVSFLNILHAYNLVLFSFPVRVRGGGPGGVEGWGVSG